MYAVIEIVHRNFEQTWYRWILIWAGFLVVIFGSKRVLSKSKFMLK